MESKYFAVIDEDGNLPMRGSNYHLYKTLRHAKEKLKSRWWGFGIPKGEPRIVRVHFEEIANVDD